MGGRRHARERRGPVLGDTAGGAGEPGGQPRGRGGDIPRDLCFCLSAWKTGLTIAYEGAPRCEGGIQEPSCASPCLLPPVFTVGVVTWLHTDEPDEGKSGLVPRTRDSRSVERGGQAAGADGVLRPWGARGGHRPLTSPPHPR